VNNADCSFERAVTKLLDPGKQHGITGAARLALEQLVRTGRPPTQYLYCLAEMQKLNRDQSFSNEQGVQSIQQVIYAPEYVCPVICADG
jgi:pyruvate formate-lyase activating enzyme-like uncharacterized protein